MLKEAERYPWDRREDESGKAYLAFIGYRDMGTAKRSLKRLPSQIGRPDTYKPVVERWSVKYRWVERVTAWDDYQERVAREATLQEIEDMRKRHIQQSVGLQTKALQRLQTLTPSELSATNVLAFITEAIKIERLARGEPETILEERRKLTDDDAKAIGQLAADPIFMAKLQRAIDETEDGPDPAGSTRQVAASRDRGETLDETG